MKFKFVRLGDDGIFTLQPGEVGFYVTAYSWWRYCAIIFYFKERLRALQFSRGLFHYRSERVPPELTLGD